MSSKDIKTRKPHAGGRKGGKCNKKPQFQENGGLSEQDPNADKKTDTKSKTKENDSLAKITFDKYAPQPISEEEKKILDMFVDGN